MKGKNKPTWIFQFAVKVLKYFLLGLFGVTLTYVLSEVFEQAQLAEMLTDVLEQWLLKIAGGVVSLVAIAIITESIR